MDEFINERDLEKGLYSAGREGRAVRHCRLDGFNLLAHLCKRNLFVLY